MGLVVKRLRMFAGPNGSGKSSIVRDLAKEWSPRTGLFHLNQYLNADDVEQALLSTGLDLSRFGLRIALDELTNSVRSGGRLEDGHPFFHTATIDNALLRVPGGNGYLAAAIVDVLREKLMRRGDSFSFETVMSHPSKVDFFNRARAEGYKTYLYFVCTTSAELNVARVRSRVASGGHAVPENKIRERYVRSLSLAREALKYAYRAYFFDNSGREPVWLAEFGPVGDYRLEVTPERLPDWFKHLLDAIQEE